MSIEQGQSIAKAAMVESLMKNQGMSYEEAVRYADSQIELANWASGQQPDEVMADNPLGQPFPDIPPPSVDDPSVAKVEETAPSADPASVLAESSPSSPSVEAPGSSPPSILDNPEAVSAVLGMGGRNREMDYAEQMRSMEQPGGRYVSGGRVYVASNPLEHIAPVVGKYKGSKKIAALEKEQQAAKQSLIDALRGKKEEEEEEDKPHLGWVPV